MHSTRPAPLMYPHSFHAISAQLNHQRVNKYENLVENNNEVSFNRVDRGLTRSKTDDPSEPTDLSVKTGDTEVSHNSYRANVEIVSEKEEAPRRELTEKIEKLDESKSQERSNNDSPGAARENVQNVQQELSSAMDLRAIENYRLMLERRSFEAHVKSSIEERLGTEDRERTRHVYAQKLLSAMSQAYNSNEYSKTGEALETAKIGVRLSSLGSSTGVDGDSAAD